MGFEEERVEKGVHCVSAGMERRRAWRAWRADIGVKEDEDETGEEGAGDESTGRRDDI